MMRMGSQGVRPRRGAWRGSRRAKAVAAACLAAGAIATAVPPTAVAYPCGEGAAASVQGRHLTSSASDECRAPQNIRPKTAPARKRKRGSISTLTVFVLAVGAALLIPIGRNGLPDAGDPFGHDPTYQRKV